MNIILITGSAGFIASHLIEELLKDKNNIIIGIDNFYSGTKDNLNYLFSIDVDKKFKFIEGDICNIEFLDNVMKEYQVKYIYHLAAIVSVQESIDNPILTNEVNIKGTLNILESARVNNIKRVVFSSSAAVYGDEPTLPKNENSLIQPISPYGHEKFVSEEYMKLYSKLYNLETVSLRYFNVYGERQNASSDYSGVISIFDKKFKDNEISMIYGDGEQYRDFVNVKDVVIANIKAMNAKCISGEVFCIGTSNKTSINQLFEYMNKKYNKSFSPIYKDSRKGDILESICDNSKAKNILKIKNFRSFESGVLEI